MNLHAIVAGAIGTVNPHIPTTVRVSTGYTTNPDGTRVPTYTDMLEVMAQIQALTYSDIRAIDGMQITGERRAIYLNGRFNMLSRPDGTGGDLVIYPDGTDWPFGTVWKIAYVLEQWPDWVKCVATRQNNA